MKKQKEVRPSSVHIVGQDFHAKVPQGWFNLERIQLEEAKATDDESKRELNMLLLNYRLTRADGGEMMVAAIDGSKAIMTVTPVVDAEIEKSKLGNEEYCKTLARQVMQPGQKIDSAKVIEVRKGLKTCSIASSTALGRKYAGVFMYGRNKPYLVMTTAEKGVELPTESLKAFVDSWYLK